MNPDFYFKLGMLLGTLDDFLIRVEEGESTEADLDRIRGFVKDVKVKFFESQKQEQST